MTASRATLTHFNGRLGEGQRSAAPVAALLLALVVGQRPALQHDVPVLPAVDVVRPLLQDPVQLDLALRV